jgi:hypothetical protein
LTTHLTDGATRQTWLKKLKEGEGPEMKPAHLYYGCIFAWNAYREERVLKDIKYNFKAALKVSQ